MDHPQKLELNVPLVVQEHASKCPDLIVLSGCRRTRRRIGPAISVSPSVEPIFSIRSTLATSVAGISFAPVLANSITSASEPFLVRPKLLKSLGREELRGVSGGMAERFQQARCNKNRNLVRFKTEKPSCLQRVETGKRDGALLPDKDMGESHLFMRLE